MTGFEKIQLIKQKGLGSIYPEKPRITVGMSTCGRAAGAVKVYEVLKREMEPLGIQVVPVGCLGYCQAEPLITLQLPGKGRYYYARVNHEDAYLIAQAVKNGEIFARKLLAVSDHDYNVLTHETIPLGTPLNQRVKALNELPFYAKQVKVATRNTGVINPVSIEEYVARGGFVALLKALEMTPKEIIDTVTVSGLRGRGGAGFPTGRKWEAAYRQEADAKYVICNADEGDPGAYMDRSVLEGDPYSVIEGMIIGGLAIGAELGIIYVRAEYPLAVEILSAAIDRARDAGFLGPNILDSGFSFDIRLAKGAGAFVCGEETALIASVEGRPGEPSARPPYPAEQGLWGKPTVINNVETWANISPILVRGSQWFRQMGTASSPGTKVFALVGNIRNNGLVEVPMGITLKEIVQDIGGGVPRGRKVKAVQTGGPSGGCVPWHLFDTPVDYEKLSGLGTIMGSGGMVVMDDQTCMVDVARYFMSFTEEESCGKCLPCREGTSMMRLILERITRGEAEFSDLKTLYHLAQAVKISSFCGLGQTAPNPVISTLRYFGTEYLEHVLYHYCRAGVCTELFELVIDPEICNGCGVCVKECPQGAITGELKKPHQLDRERCLKCRLCMLSCSQGAIRPVPVGGKLEDIPEPPNLEALDFIFGDGAEGAGLAADFEIPEGMLLIDGQAVPAETEKSLLEIMAKAGFKVPSLCFHPALPSYGACRLCLVEVEEKGKKGFVAACTKRAEPGLVVHTQTPKLELVRKMLISLLKRRVGEDEAIDELAAHWGWEPLPAAEDTSSCVLCGLCVRACRQGALRVIDFVGRGIRRRVSTLFERPPADCIGCQACLNVCPTGHITSAFHEGKLFIYPFAAEVEVGLCERCGRPLHPKPQVKRSQELLPMVGVSGNLCAECRRREQAQKLMAFKAISDHV